MPYEASPIGAIPPQNGGNVGNAKGIERQKGRAARKRSVNGAKPLTDEDCFNNMQILVLQEYTLREQGFIQLCGLLLYFLIQKVGL